jgi:uroporphyrinogen-III synthase
MNEEQTTASESADAMEPGDTPRPRGGRAARLHAEDAADATRAPRWRDFTDTSGTATAEPPPDEPRRASARGFVFFLVVVLVIAATNSLWLPRMKQALQRAPKTESAPVTAGAPASSAPQSSATPQPATAQQSAAELLALRQEIDQKLVGLNTHTAEPASPVMGDTLGSQAKQLASLSARVASLEGAIGNSAHLDDLNRRLSALEGKSADASSLLALADRVNALESASRSAIAIQTGRVALVLAVAQWRDAVAAGRPFALELESVKAVADRGGQTLNNLDDPRFASRATTGIATMLALQERFDDTAAHVTRAAAVPGGFEGFWGRSLERMMSIFTIRRVNGLAEGNEPSAVLARAGAYLNDGNLAAAVTEMEHLEGGAAVAALPWLEEARARVTAEQAANDATTKAVAALGALGATPAPAPQ